MKKLFYLFICTLTVACTSRKSHTTTLEGEIKGLTSDTLYLCGTDLLYDRIDTLTVEGGKFKAELSPDTLVCALLLFDDGTEYPIFLDKQSHIRVEGNSAHLEALNVSGHTANDEMTQFNQIFAGPARPTPEAIQQKAKEFILDHPHSLVSVYLLERYLVCQPDPDWRQIERLIDGMAGELKDRPYIDRLQKYIREHDKLEPGKALPYFSLPNAQGKKVSRNDFKDCYLLVHFWASYDESCRPMNDSLRALYAREKGNKQFAMLGISLDVDTAAWHRAIRQDTLKWEQVCDGQGWTSEFIRNCALQQLPTNVLLTPTGRIEAKDMSKSDIERRLKRIAEEEKERKERAKQTKFVKRIKR